MRRFFFLTVAVTLLAIACGSSAEGESCDQEGKVGGDCDDGLVCGKKIDSSADLTCLKICNSDVDCSGGGSCNGVGGTNFKGCRNKK